MILRAKGVHWTLFEQDLLVGGEGGPHEKFAHGHRSPEAASLSERKSKLLLQSPWVRHDFIMKLGIITYLEEEYCVQVFQLSWIYCKLSHVVKLKRRIFLSTWYTLVVHVGCPPGDRHGNRVNALNLLDGHCSDLLLLRDR